MEEGELLGSGKLKIFFSYAPGTGKTRTMLTAAGEEQKRGVDVVVGYLEKYCDAEPPEDGLEYLPPRQIRYQGKAYQEFDLDAALERKPELILVDEMAHTNREGSRHLKRYQDIEELLRAGIHVYTTVNVQNLESLKDVVFSATENTVTERIPDIVFDRADQVEFVDMDPEDLLRRIESKEVQTPPVFTLEKLNALREIAFRRAADCIGNRPGEKKQRVREHLLICLSGAPSNATVIRTAARMAEAFHGELTALYVENTQVRDDEIRENLRLARELGARIATVYGEDTALQIAEYAQISGVTKIVLGRSARRGHSRPMVDRLSELAPDIDIYIIPDQHRTMEKRKFLRLSPEKITFRETAVSLGMMTVCTIINFFFAGLGVEEANIILIYILGVLGVAVLTGGKLYSLAVSLLVVLLFNFFFTEPYYTLFSAPGYLVTFLIMLVAAIVSSTLTRRIKNQAILSARKAYRTGTLLETSRKLQRARSEREIFSVAAAQLGKLLERTIVIYPANEKKVLGQMEIFPGEDGERWTREDFLAEREIAEWVFRNNKHAGATTHTFSEARCLYLAVRGKDQPLAVAGIFLKDSDKPADFEKELMVAILDECGLALEIEQIWQAKQELEETARQETLRANLLRAISHDLRTPLTTIYGSCSAIIENYDSLEKEQQVKLLGEIREDAEWLIRMVENLLSITKIGDENVKIVKMPTVIEELLDTVLVKFSKRYPETEVAIEMSEEFITVPMDAMLIEQVFLNLLENAVQHAQGMTELLIRVKLEGEKAVFSIADNGCGIPKEQINDLFTGYLDREGTRADCKKSNMGIGLSVCAAIVKAHGGSITAANRENGGAEFRFDLSMEG